MSISPMMQHYLSLKEEYPDVILFYRLGDFYEMFFEDAKLVSRELELTLTGKDCGLPERAPMCGVPYHAVETYLQKLISKGYKVAICEQMEDPAQAKGLVKRSVIRVITPGTIIEGNMLKDRQANYIAALFLQKNQGGCAFCDVSTGEFYLYQIADLKSSLSDEMNRIAPSEVLTNDREALELYAPELLPRFSAMEDEAFAYKTASEAMRAHFGRDIGEMGFSEDKLAVRAAGALIRYLLETQKNALNHIITAQPYAVKRFMILDRAAMRNLELLETVREKSRKGSLLWVLDKTCTTMGGRLLRSWIEQPLKDQARIEARLDGVEQLIHSPMEAESLRESLSGVYDVERLLSHIAYDTINGRDCLALSATLQLLPLLKKTGEAFDAPILREAFEAMDELPELRDTLARAISPDAPLTIREGGMIRDGYNAELDELRGLSGHSKELLAGIEARERERTGIKNLKIGFNRVFGYYLEVTRSFLAQVPYDYVRKQTLTGAERFITEELKQLESKILGAEENATRLEYTLFCEIRDQIKALLPQLQRTANAIKTLDVLLSLAKVSSENGYIRPVFNDEGRYQIVNGRHPVVEASIGREGFVPNDTSLSADERIMIITGPNMAGKSTYMRQVALIVVMAHMGCFVPADSADIALTDRVFTRIGASDDLYGGQSTFMVEMTEMASILKYATPKSLLILDEVGRGTSTFDGLAIAWAAVEYIGGEKCGARTLFATHYHELTELEGRLSNVVNFRITAKERGEDVIFLRKIVRGGADHSYGVSVAQLAGLPKSLIARARQIMAKLEVDGQQRGTIGQNILQGKKLSNRQMGFTDFEPMELVQELASIDVTAMTPMEALNRLFELNEKAKRI